MRKEYYENINLEEYENIDISLAEVKKHKIKKELRLKVAEKAKSNKKKYIIVASLVGFITLGIISQPVLAEQIPALKKVYEIMGIKNENNLIEIGKTINLNGIKITIDKIVGSENKVVIGYKVKASKEILDKNDEMRGLTISAVPDDFKGVGGGSNSIRVSDTEVYKTDSTISNTKFNTKGKIKLSLLGQGIGINGEYFIEVDFSDNINNKYEKELASEVPLDDIELKEIQSTNFGTLINVKDIGMKKGADYLLNIDNKIYFSQGSLFSDKDGILEYNNVKIDDIKNAENMNFIKINQTKTNYVSDISLEGLSNEDIIKKVNERDKEEKKKKDKLLDKKNEDISYMSNFTFDNGKKVELSNCKRENGKIYIDIKGDKDNEAFSYLSSMYLTDYEDRYNARVRPNYATIIEDGYRVEFDDIIEGDVKIQVWGHSESRFTTLGEKIKLNIK